ncbi:MAG TPA: flagellar motor protein MotB [Sedimentisphaerales bacterium]|nr:flagellar motor protein MotB [Sedimentisphaerales bacterium]
MAGHKRQASDGGASAPIWLLSFSDCMTNLLTFFVLLVTFSSYGDDERQNIRALGEAMRKTFPGFTKSNPIDNTAVVPTHQIWAVEEPAYGSEKPSVTTTSDATEGVLRDLPETRRYENCRALLMPSERVFLGKSMVLSPEGRHITALIASFLKDVPGIVVVSEHGPDADSIDAQMGLSRAWAVIEVLKAQQGIELDRCSISTASTLTTKDLGENDSPSGQQRDERMLEIVLVGRSVQD